VGAEASDRQLIRLLQMSDLVAAPAAAVRRRFWERRGFAWWKNSCFGGGKPVVVFGGRLKEEEMVLSEAEVEKVAIVCEDLEKRQNQNESQQFLS